MWANSLAILATALMLDICITIFSPGYSYPLKYCPESSSEIFYEHLYVLTDSEYDAYSKNISRIVFK